MNETLTLEEIEAIDSEALDAEVADTYSLDDLDRIDSWSDGKSLFQETAVSYAKGLASDVARIPDEIGQLIKEQGEKGGSGLAIPSFNDGVAIAKKLTGKEIELGKQDEIFIRVGDMLSQKTEGFIKRTNLEPEEGSRLSQFFFDLGAGTSSVATSLGLLYLTRSPSLLFGLFGSRQKGQIYKEARTARKEPIDASVLSSAAGIVEGGIEAIGGLAFLKSISFNKFLTRSLIRAAEQGLEEGLQQTGEEVLTKMSGVRRDSLNESLLRIGYSASLGMLLGAPAGLITSAIEKTKVKSELREAGLTPSQVDAVIGKVTEKTIKDGSVKQEIATFLEEEIAVTEKALNENPQATKQETEETPLRFHGTSKKISELSDISYTTLNYYGQGFYTTDDYSIAKGYSKKGKGQEPTIYNVSEKEDVPIFDMESTIPEDIKKELIPVFGDFDYILLGSEEMDYRPVKNLREAYDSLREEGTAERLTADDMQEYFDATRAVLESKGFRGLQHKGGLRTGKKEHQVKIYWQPSKDIKISEIKPDYQDVSEEAGVATATMEKNDIYAKNFAMKQAQQPEGEGRKLYDKISGALSRVAEPISTRLKKINPKLKTRLRRYEFDLKQRTLEDEKLTKPFLEAYQKLSPKDQSDLDLALKNNDTEKVKEVTKRTGMSQEYKDVKDVLGAVYVRAKETGLDMGFIEDYFPRKVGDVEGMLKFFQKQDTWPQMQKAINRKEETLGRKMTDEEKVEMLNSMLRGYGGGKVKLARPGNVKKRQISQVSPELNKFYQDSPQALLNYIYRLNDFIEARRFFGKSVKGTEISQKTIEDSIGAFVLDLLESGEISGTQAKEVSDILKARFAQKGPGQITSAVRNITYIETMGNVTSAITQIGDIAFSLYKSGFYRTGKALSDALSGKSKMSKEDIGIERIAEEFSEKSKTAKALDTVFKYTGLEWMDRLGKETTINAALDKYSELAQKPTQEFNEQMEIILGDEAGRTIKDLKEKRESDNVKFLLFSELADVQPVALSEMPEQYLKSGNGRLLYMLKTYTIKQIDVFRNEVFLKMRSNPKESLGNLVRLSSMLILANATADLIKDLILNRPIDPEDYVIDNILRLFGLSKFSLYKFKKEGVSAGVSSVVVPPLGKFISSGAKDTDKMLKGEFTAGEAEIIQSIPWFGKLYYWWFGGGKAKSKKKSSGRIFS